ncbi:MAG TPA: hypothetical protein VM487_03185 [Phycisphaerae bacterium]|nr:hypothetical protein [Phycisphaerae bacterium]
MLNILVDAGLTPRRNIEIAREAGLSSSGAMQALARLQSAGWARESGGGWLLGPTFYLAIAKQNEENAATSRRLQEISDALNPPAPAGPDGGEQILLLREVVELKKQNLEIKAALDRLTRNAQKQQKDIA